MSNTLPKQQKSKINKCFIYYIKLRLYLFTLNSIFRFSIYLYLLRLMTQPLKFIKNVLKIICRVLKTGWDGPKKEDFLLFLYFLHIFYPFSMVNGNSLYSKNWYNTTKEKIKRRNKSSRKILVYSSQEAKKLQTSYSMHSYHLSCLSDVFL